MNALEFLINVRRLDPGEVMNKLQLEGAGIVSDECVMPCDVAPSDIPKAIEFLGL